MKRVFFSIFAVLGLAASVSAEQVYFRGTATTTSIQDPAGLFNNRLWTLLVTYTPSVSGPATITAANLFFYSNDATDHKNESFSLIPATNVAQGNVIEVQQNAGPNNDGLILGTDFGPSELGRGTIFAYYDNLTVVGSVDVPNTNGTADNIRQLAAIGNTVSGSFRLSPRPSTGSGTLQITLNGFAAVPEPSTFALLGGLGLVVGRRIWKRRSAKTQNAATV